jgi:hypothetical protein
MKKARPGGEGPAGPSIRSPATPRGLRPPRAAADAAGRPQRGPARTPATNDGSEGTRRLRRLGHHDAGPLGPRPGGGRPDRSPLRRTTVTRRRFASFHQRCPSVTSMPAPVVRKECGLPRSVLRAAGAGPVHIRRPGRPARSSRVRRTRCGPAISAAASLGWPSGEPELLPRFGVAVPDASRTPRLRGSPAATPEDPLTTRRR